MVTKTDLALLKITLDDVVPKVERRIIVPLDLSFDRLHTVLQAAMGWTNSHLWEFYLNDQRWSVPDLDWPDGPADARSDTLYSAIARTGVKSFNYIYDMGDSWEHIIEIERIYEGETGERQQCPKLVSAMGRCPLEDIGGSWGYAEFLEAIGDPDHDRHQEFAEYYPDDFDPNLDQTDFIKADLARLAKRWAPRKRNKVPAKRSSS